MTHTKQNDKTKTFNLRVGQGESYGRTVNLRRTEVTLIN